MGSLFDSMMAAGSLMLDQQFKEPVTLTRGSNTTARVTASWSGQTDEVVTADDKHTAVVDRFWFVKQTDYVIQDAAVEPRTGDRLTQDTGDVWEVLPKRGMTPVVNYAGGTYWKIATKQVT